ncbi:transglutaminaseTgpA domain-containing protein [Ornithinicoccus hortensis]|uniref:Transglutaminase superfamily protein n=1 Tax=Ornithinicoccus hortensis TaxID=82346 RepID=A0A542YR34_9MICO|nr:DUF3488 and transglutaminase-like domain-containing protein [Ornithinicoccus hortensis]TQL50527.1 transglutaminase superfamily protein [Ornithinicoccus hortensis]
MRPSLDRSLWQEAAVAAVASLCVAWPVSSLLRENVWLEGALIMVLLVAVSGALLRAVGAGPTTTVLVQAVVALWAVLYRYLGDTLWYLLPTPETISGASRLLQEAGQVLRTYAAPAPTTEGVEFLIVLVITLTALSVDSIGVTGRSPAAAGIPLAAGFLVSVSNTGEAMAPYYFVAVAAAWLVMIAQQGGRVVGGWSSADRREAVGARDVSHGPTGYRAVARVLGACTIIGALLAASLLPHLPPTYFADGLARNPDGRSVGGDSGSVSFTETMDLRQDLNNPSQAPVLRYRTNSAVPTPLRVTATSVFEDGQWLPPDYSETPAERGTDRFEWGGETGALDPDVPGGTAEITVVQNSVRAPALAVPSPVVSADLGVAWAVDGGTAAIRVEAPPESYQVRYLEIAPRGGLPEGIGDEPATPPPGQEEQFEEYLRVDPASEQAISALADEVVGNATNDVDVASRIQNHFRTGAYLYSLELAPGGDESDPISHFLQTRRGYCVQFATAMVMMARHEGIPARMAVGFLPGTIQQDGTRAVRASDAHTWPELYIDGMGWTRFEPTPGRAGNTPPGYAQSQTELPEDDPTADTDPTPTATPTAPDDATGGGQESGLWDSVKDLAPTLGRVLVGLVVLAALMLLVPWAGRRYREAGLRSAQNDPDRIEGHWLLLTRSLEDLGVGPPGARSPREMRDHYLAATSLDRRSNEALGRAADTLERSRYASDTAQQEGQVAVMARDVRAVVDAAHEKLPWNVRVHNRVLPRSGLHAIRDGVSRLLRRR